MTEPAVVHSRCPHCGCTERDQDHCTQCGLTHEKAEERAAHHRRQLEHRRRADLVIAATVGMPMPRRIRIAKHLLLECGPLPNGEPWDRAFQAWRKAGTP